MNSDTHLPATEQEWLMAAYQRGHRLQPEPFEDVTYVQPRVNKRALHRELATDKWRGREFPTPGWVRIGGRDGEMVLGPVWHNGEAYVRQHPVRGEISGCVRRLRAHGLPVAELVSDRWLVERALAAGDFRRIRREEDGAEMDVALLGPWPSWTGQKRTPALRFIAGRLAAFNPEPAARRAFNIPMVRHEVVARLTDGSLAAQLAAWRDRLTAAGCPAEPWPRLTAAGCPAEPWPRHTDWRVLYAPGPGSVVGQPG